MEMFLKLICIFLCILKVSSMALKGPALTRYDPCGLGIIYFDQIIDKYWQGVVNFGLYDNLKEAEMEISFDKQVLLYTASVNSSFTVQTTTWLNFTIKPNGPIPDKYVFLLQIDTNDIDRSSQSNSNVPVVAKFTLNNVTLCNNEIKATQTISSLSATSPDDKIYAHICGRRSMEHTELVSLRTEAKAGEWPWHVAIFLKNGVWKYRCGGSIISSTAILTAGHCVFVNGTVVEAHTIAVVAGSDNLRVPSQIGRQTLRAEYIILHPSYNDNVATSDLAIIRVNRLQYTEYVQPICIWGPVYDKTNLYGQEAVVAGFGTTENDTLSDTLRATYTIVQNDTVCLAYSSAVYKHLMDEFTLCAGFGPQTGINPRNGDSGGGLVVSSIQSDHMVSWYLRGVLSKCGVSPGHRDCDPTYYVVYTDVGPHYGWIFHNSGLRIRDNIA